MPTYFSLLWEIISFPFTRMEAVILKDSINKEFHQILLSPNEVIINCYDNPFRSFLITNMRIISIQKFFLFHLIKLELPRCFVYVSQIFMSLESPVLLVLNSIGFSKKQWVWKRSPNQLLRFQTPFKVFLNDFYRRT